VFPEFSASSSLVSRSVNSWCSSTRARKGLGTVRLAVIVTRAKSSNNGQQGTRVSDWVLNFPENADRYLRERKYRKPIWTVVITLFGFYSGTLVTLGFGTLNANDAAAGTLTAVFYEIVQKHWVEAYTNRKIPLPLWFTKGFTLGFLYSCICDGVKLGSGL